MVILQLDRLAKQPGGEDHLAAIDLALEPGTFHVLLGPSGAGKTTLLRLIAGLDRPTSGTVCLAGEGAPPGGELRGRVAMVYQEFVNYPSLSVRDNIAAPLRARGDVPRPAVERRVGEVADQLELTPLLDRLPSELSGGQQQRTALGRALVRRAQVVLLDEPLANLDYKLRESLRALVRRIFEAGDSIVVYTTTDPAEALWFGGDIGVLHEGRLLQHGPARSVYDAPADERVAALMSDPPINLWDAALEDGALALSSGVAFPLPRHLADLEPGPCRLGLRAHRLSTTPAGPESVRLPLTVALAEVDGSETLLHGRSGGLAVLAQETGVRRAEPGAALDVHFDPRALFAFHPDGRLRAAPPPLPPRP